MSNTGVGAPVNSRWTSRTDAIGQLAGAGAAPPTVPTTSAVGDLPAKGNCIIASGTGAPARSGAGTYTATVKTRYLPMPVLLIPRIAIVSATGKQAAITSFNPTTGAIGILVSSPAGVATDAAVGDRIYFDFGIAESKEPQ
jgi:hypothetical protein